MWLQRPREVKTPASSPPAGEKQSQDSNRRASEAGGRALDAPPPSGPGLPAGQPQVCVKSRQLWLWTSQMPALEEHTVSYLSPVGDQCINVLLLPTYFSFKSLCALSVKKRVINTTELYT